MAERQVFDARGKNVVSAPDDEILLPADDLQIALAVETSEVAAHEPTLRVERILARGLVVEVTEHEERTARADFPDLAGSGLAIGLLLIPKPGLVAAARLPARR